MRKSITTIRYAIYALYVLVAVGILAVLVIVFSTGSMADSGQVQKDTVESKFGSEITVLTIDKCEYVWVKRGYGRGLTHKGNCKNPEHASN